jgi:8-oxo-dGTP diphosphatase
MNQIELIARAVIIKKDKILLCKQKDKDYYFLPGGHINFGETAQQALQREIQEELGVPFEDEPVFLSMLENIYKDGNGQRHELNFIFTARIDDKIESKEEHIEFAWQETERIYSVNVKPVAIQKIISNVGLAEKGLVTSVE